MGPAIEGKPHHFYHVGIHDALFVMQDAETKTLWNHITGQAVYGRLVGHTLGPVGNLLHMTVKQAFTVDPSTRIAISDQRYLAGGRQFGSVSRGPRVGGGAGRGAAGPGLGGGRGPGASLEIPNARMADRFAATLGAEDPRRPRMDIGLGVWIGDTARYYPMERIRTSNGVIVDRIDGKNVLVYMEPESSTPAALFVGARSAKREGDEIHLDDGSTVKSGVLTDRRGRRSSEQRPQQMFTRWYGFSLTFPGCEVFGQ